ncbi:acetyltransferase [Paenibacillus alvei]|nr:acetyltransferase [Paenibacillus alvei]MBG9745827.1 acetyltransferase [Paenibacillus alvei]
MEGIRLHIRKAIAGDAPGIARVHVDSWRTTYQGIVSDTYLSGLSVQARQTMWEHAISQLTADKCIFVVQQKSGEIVGFAMGGPSRSEQFPNRSELYALYLLSSVQGQGIGKMLVSYVMGYMKSCGYISMLTWVLKGNSALQFYRRTGAVIVGEEDIEIGGEPHTEIAMEWAQLSIS